jgi:hypothetical protein
MAYNIQGDATVSGAVPEPSTWAMLLLGFAGLCYAGYRQAKTSAAALAAQLHRIAALRSAGRFDDPLE